MSTSSKIRKRLESYYSSPPLTDNGSVFTKFNHVDEPTVFPKSNFLVITVAVGKSQKVLSATVEAMKSYADKCGADFIALTNATQDWPLAEKFRIAHYAKFYERILFVDSDVFIRSCSPIIFDYVPCGTIGMHDDTSNLLKSMFGIDWLRIELDAICKSQNINPPTTAFCLNSGVVVFDSSDRSIWSPPEKTFPIVHCSEQNIVQIRVQETERLFQIDQKWNWQWWANTEFEGIESSYFIHLAGMSQAHPNMQIPMLRALSLNP